MDSAGPLTLKLTSSSLDRENIRRGTLISVRQKEEMISAIL